MLVANPRERQVLRTVLQEEHERDRADYQKQGDKHRSEKSINHVVRRLPNRPPEGCKTTYVAGSLRCKTTYVAGPLRCKTGYACRTFLFGPLRREGEKVKVQVPANAKHHLRFSKGGAKVLPRGKKKRKRDAFVFIEKLYYEERCLHGPNDPIYISFVPIIGGGIRLIINELDSRRFL